MMIIVSGLKLIIFTSMTNLKVLKQAWSYFLLLKITFLMINYIKLKLTVVNAIKLLHYHHRDVIYINRKNK